jgi:N-acetylmuramoyl-L-alanine amidase CwlA
MKYQITQKLIPIKKDLPCRRNGSKIGKVGFIVAHDVGNLDVPANNYYRCYINNPDKSASAHIFLDDKEIIEVIPAFKNPEKAWHVLYDRPLDNQKYGDDANDIAIGVEMTYFTDKARSQKAYEKYVWVLAYLCRIYSLDPKKDIIGHMILDHERKTDPANGLKYSGHTYQNLLDDVVVEYNKIDKNGDEKPVSNTTTPTKMTGTEAIKYLANKGRISSPQEWIDKLVEVKNLDALFIKWAKDVK